MSSDTGVSGLRYRSLLRGDRRKLVDQHKEQDSDAGALARLVEELAAAVEEADKTQYYFNMCPVCGTNKSAPISHHRSCTWPEIVSNIRREKNHGID